MKALLLLLIFVSQLVSQTVFAQDTTTTPTADTTAATPAPGNVEKTLEENIGSAAGLANTKKNFFGAFAALGLPATANYGLAYYYGEQRDIGIILQAGSGKSTGTISYDTEYKELMLVDGSTATDSWNKAGGIAIGVREISVGTEFTGSNTLIYQESETFKQTYLKLSLGMNKFYRSGFNWGFDFGFTFNLDSSSTQNFNANAINTTIDDPIYGDHKQNYNFIKKLLAGGMSFQLNILKVGWYF
jgi:hypothetical protein